VQSRSFEVVHKYKRKVNKLKLWLIDLLAVHAAAEVTAMSDVLVQ
jgi:hypothetical protein